MSLIFETKIQPLEQSIYEICGEEFNIASPKQLGEVIFNKLGIKGGRKKKSGFYSTSADVLEKLTEEGNKIASLILR